MFLDAKLSVWFTDDPVVVFLDVKLSVDVCRCAKLSGWFIDVPVIVFLDAKLSCWVVGLPPNEKVELLPNELGRVELANGFDVLPNADAVVDELDVEYADAVVELGM